MTRRYFFLGALAAPAIVRAQATAARPITLVILIDGFAPEYLEQSDMPNLKRMCREGACKTGRSVIPSVTNVNNASLVTGSFPEQHGITTNFFHDPKAGQSVEMESSEFLRRPTIFEVAKRRGIRSALITSKDKVRTLCARGADIAVSAEMPGREWVEKIGKQENMYSPEVNFWTFRTARHVLRESSVQLMYLSTTDYMMHTYAPASSQSLDHLHRLDGLLGDIVSDHPGIEVYLTADHGMNAKREAVDLARILRAGSVRAEAVPIIKDKHKVHHQNLGGACYIYLERPADLAKAADLLKTTQGVEDVYDTRTAARMFHLELSRIGDLFVLATKDAVFGDLDHPREPTTVRSHGSRHESQVPLVIYGRKVDIGRYEYNLDLTRHLLSEWA
jgi:phosphonoacetate hydrolase